MEFMSLWGKLPTMMGNKLSFEKYYRFAVKNFYCSLTVQTCAS